MKKDLITAIIAAVVSSIIAYFVCGIFLPGLEDVTFPVLESKIDYTLSNPDNEVFNYRAINPTVEVYVGDCTEYDENGACLDDNPEEQAADELEEIIEDTEDTEQTDKENSSENTNKQETNKQESTNGSTD